MTCTIVTTYLRKIATLGRQSQRMIREILQAFSLRRKKTNVPVRRRSIVWQRIGTFEQVRHVLWTDETMVLVFKTCTS